MKSIRFIWVGRLKTPHWQESAQHYQTRLARSYKLMETCLKDGPAKLPPDQRMQEEGERILKALQPTDIPILLDERGKNPTSRQLADMLDSLMMDGNRTPCFIIGGAFGVSRDVRKQAQRMLSLSNMTFPHEMARVMLLEQLYRASAILEGSPYHHD